MIFEYLYKRKKKMEDSIHIKQEALDNFHYHEALDRTHSINIMIDELLLNHPVINKHNELLDNVEKANQLLLDVYQRIGILQHEINDE